MVGAGASLLMEEANHQHFLTGKDNSRTVDTTGGSNSVVEGDRACEQPRLGLCLCGHSMVFLPLSQIAPLNPIARFVPWKSPYFTLTETWIGSKQKSINSWGRSQPWDAPRGQFEEARREFWKLSPRGGRVGREVCSSGGLWRRGSPVGGEGHQWEAHCKHLPDPVSWRDGGWPETSGATELQWLFLWK